MFSYFTKQLQSADKTQEQLAHEINKSKNWVKNNEQGINRYYFEDLVKIADLCNIDIIFKERKGKQKKEM